jgi:natural product biosynthesis luciferase-like monooxygenase protein
VFPAPVRTELPVWLTAAGNAETFRTAGKLGGGVLTHLLGQGMEELAAKIAEYRSSLPEGSGRGHVVLMLHTFLGADRDAVRETVRAPFSDYLRSSLGLLLKAAGDVMPDLTPDDLTESDIDFLVQRGFDRYFETGGLFGTVADAMALLSRISALDARAEALGAYCDSNTRRSSPTPSWTCVR